MSQARVVRVRLAAALVAAPLISTFTAPAVLGFQQPAGAPVEQAATPPAPLPAGASPIALTKDARETREEFEGLLRRLPPSVGRVLRTEPSLMRNGSYLATYPALTAFLQQHPEVTANPGYFLENVNVSFWNPPAPPNPRSDAIHLWRNLIETVAVFTGFVIVTACVLWLIRTLLNYRRWLRAFRTQTELQSKMVDRFSSSDELIAYLQSGAGRWAVEPEPVVPAASKVVLPGTPLNRVLWSVQAGLVLSALAIGLLFVSNRVIEEVAEVFYAVGVMILATGIGFVLSAAASYILSQRLGVLAPRP